MYIRSALAGMAAAAAVALTGCDEGRRTLRVFAADALAASFRDVEHAFERQHPDVDVRLEVMGSVMATRLVPLRRGDVLAVADHRLVEKILGEAHAAWVAKFASTEIVLAGHTSSNHRAEITSDNWYEILLKPNVRFGIANPSQDPCGYYARMSWELAQKHYFASRGNPRPLARQLQERCRPEFVAIDANELISAYLNMARVDYAFVYKAHAVDLKLPYTPLPREVNLGDAALEDYYGSVQVNVPNYRGGTETLTGCSIAFGITLLKDAVNRSDAEGFIRFVLSPEGQGILKVSGFQAISPARVPAWGRVPDFLAGLATPES
ncbi:MAG TPA: extracellular solute-binding protein [Planctomycetota bacterium]|nr:extracellular solute-binding protein [Planctomycetota bacterium]HRR81443.1 extracellular solute-binding protein [Planctomycetota bacterium]HRT96739.1 extracellular solute-binding protein [Planctomycetota bacterium]